MENIVANRRWNATVPIDDAKLRLATRPIIVGDKSNKIPRRTGAAAEDFGSTFVKVSQNKKSKSNSGSQTRSKDDDLEGPDPLDFLSGTGSENDDIIEVKPKKGKVVYTDEKGGTHDYHPSYMPEKANVLKNLKFKKIKSTNGDGDSLDAPTSQPTTRKEARNAQSSGYGQSSPPSSQSYPTRSTAARSELSPIGGSESTKRTPGPDRHIVRGNAATNPAHKPSAEESRPKPRPRGKAADTGPKPFPDLDASDNKPPNSPMQRMSVSGARPFPLGDDTPRSSNTRPIVEGLKPTAFPSLSPTSTTPTRLTKPAAFPSLSPTIATPTRLKKPAAFPPISPMATPVHSTNKQGSSGMKKVPEKRAVSDSVAKRKPADFPTLSPAPTTKSKTAPKKKKGLSARRIESSDESEAAPSFSTAQPFPMSSQDFDSFGSPIAAGPSSNLGKRSSSGSDDESENKRRKSQASDVILLDDDDSDGQNTVIDPKKLCPYCDALLPSSPTPRLKYLLATTAKKSVREPRATNPLGRNASFAVFIAVCQRHRFESKILPEAELKGWPKTIDWGELGKRVRCMKGALMRIIEDVKGEGTEDEYDELYGDGDEVGSARAQCIFWQEMLAEVKLKGARAVAGVRGQFETFDRTQPGYYGEMGSVIIHQTLYDLFPPASIDPNLVTPLTPTEFLQRILVPEVAVRLIMEDMKLSEMEDAVKVLRESASYGVSMFPADEEEGDGAEDGKMDAADIIIMERARKRRKELEASESEEQEIMTAEESQGISDSRDRPKRPEPRKRKKGKAKVGGVESELPETTSRPRPKPRRIGRTADSSNNLASETEAPSSPGPTSMIDMDTDINDRSSDKYAPARRRPLSRTDTNLNQHAADDATLKKLTVSHKSSNVDIDLCSSGDDGDAEWDTGRMLKGKKNCHRTSATTASDDDVVQVKPLLSSKTPMPSRSRTKAQFDYGSEDETPKARNRSERPAASSTLDPPEYDLPPLLRAQNRKREKQAMLPAA